MQCKRCGKEMGNSIRCNFCGYTNTNGNVREMSDVEKDFYNGLTIDAQTGEESSNSQGRRSTFYGFTPRGTYVSYNSGGLFSRLFDKFLRALANNNVLARIALALIGLAIGALMFFVALPILFVLLAMGIAMFTFAQFRR